MYIQKKQEIISPKSIFIRLIMEEQLNVTPFVVKGAIMRCFPNEKFVAFINGEYHGIYLYPRIQVKVLRKQLCLFAINEGIPPTLSLLDKLQSIEIKGIDYSIIDREEIYQETDLFKLMNNQYNKYKFITPWVALNERQLAQYEPLFSNERRIFLNNLLMKNLEFISNNVGVPVEDQIQVRFVSSSLTPKTIEYSKYGSFKGYLTTNVTLPDYIGLGNSISKGLGTLIRIPDSGKEHTGKDRANKVFGPIDLSLPEPEDVRGEISESDVENNKISEEKPDFGNEI